MLDKDEKGRYCGYLQIDEMDKRKHFPRRYFLLDKENGLVKWFEEKPQASNKASVCGMINIGYITKVDIVNKPKLEFCFVINTPFRPYYAQASNQSDLEEWVDVLNDASKITVPPEALLPKTEEEEKANGFYNNEDRSSGGALAMKVVGGVVMKKSMSQADHSHQPVTRKLSENGISSSNSSKRYSSLQNIDISNEEIVKTGWGTKQGHIRKNWKRRFFKLSKTGFSYYKSEKDLEEPLRYISIRDIIFAKEDGAHHRENLLFVVTTDKIYYIQADSSNEMRSWIEAFRDAIDAFRNNTYNQQATSTTTATKSSSFREKLKQKFQR